MEQWWCSTFSWRETNSSCWVAGWWLSGECHSPFFVSCFCLSRIYKYYYEPFPSSHSSLQMKDRHKMANVICMRHAFISCPYSIYLLFFAASQFAFSSRSATVRLSSSTSYAHRWRWYLCIALLESVSFAFLVWYYQSLATVITCHYLPFPVIVRQGACRRKVCTLGFLRRAIWVAMRLQRLGMLVGLGGHRGSLMCFDRHFWKGKLVECLKFGWGEWDWVPFIDGVLGRYLRTGMTVLM